METRNQLRDSMIYDTIIIIVCKVHTRRVPLYRCMCVAFHYVQTWLAILIMQLVEFRISIPTHINVNCR